MTDWSWSKTLNCSHKPRTHPSLPLCPSPAATLATALTSALAAATLVAAALAAPALTAAHAAAALAASPPR